MKVTIVPVDNAVYKDGKCWMGIDLSTCDIPTDVHALQWKDTAGWIEFVDRDDGTKPANQPITELPAWATAAVAKWDEQQAAADAAAQAAAEAANEQASIPTP